MNSGVNPTSINIGTNTGAKIAHLAEADPMKMLMNATTKMNKMTNGIPCNPIAFNISAPLFAMIVPKFE